MSKNGKLIFKDFDPYVTSSFGYRTRNGVKEFHRAVDYGTNRKKLPQYPIEKGIVLKVGQDVTRAKYVFIKYDRLGYIGMHYHLDSFLVKNNDEVNENTIIGYTGDTGDTTGVHLHYGWFKIEEWDKAYSKRKWEDFEQYNYVEVNEEESPEENIEPKSISDDFEVGDEVIFNGTLYGDSYGNNPGQRRTNYKTTIALKVNNRPYPYNIYGRKKQYLGWVRKKDLKKI